MRAWAHRLGVVGDVVAFDYDYRREGRKAPDRLPKLIAAHRAALAAARVAGRPVVLIGRSMGSRVGLHVAAVDAIDAAVCLAYPLVGANGALRDAALRDAPVPVVLVQGTRDPMAPLDALRAVVADRARPTRLHVVDGADHALEIGGPSAAREARQAAVDAAIVAEIRTALATWGIDG